jgi:hypothetical protein
MAVVPDLTPLTPLGVVYLMANPSFTVTDFAQSAARPLSACPGCQRVFPDAGQNTQRPQQNYSDQRPLEQSLQHDDLLRRKWE